MILVGSHVTTFEENLVLDCAGCVIIAKTGLNLNPINMALARGQFHALLGSARKMLGKLTPRYVSPAEDIVAILVFLPIAVFVEGSALLANSNAKPGMTTNPVR